MKYKVFLHVLRYSFRPFFLWIRILPDRIRIFGRSGSGLRKKFQSGAEKNPWIRNTDLNHPFRFALMEEKVLVSSVLRHYSLHTTLRPQEIPLLAQLILRPKHGIQVSLSKRSSTN